MAYSNDRAKERERLRQEGLQNTQRSWSNYVGDSPIARLVGRQPTNSLARAYADSPRYGPNARSAISDGGYFASGVAAAQQDLGITEEENNLLPKGYSRREGDPAGQWRNEYGYLEPEEWYTKDPESKSWKKKTEKEYRDYKESKKATSGSSGYGYTEAIPFPYTI